MYGTMWMEVWIEKRMGIRDSDKDTCGDDDGLKKEGNEISKEQW